MAVTRLERDTLSGKARVLGKARLSGGAQTSGKAQVFGKARFLGRAGRSAFAPCAGLADAAPTSGSAR